MTKLYYRCLSFCVYFLLLFVFLFYPSLLSAKQQLGFDQLFKEVLKRSEQIELSDLSLQRLKAQIKQTPASLLPEVQFQYQHQFQDSPDTSESGVGGSLTRFSRPELAFSVTQKLFQGLREYRVFKISQLKKEELLLRKQEVERELFKNFSQVYLNILNLQKQIQSQLKIESLLQSEIKEMKKRNDLGKSKLSSLELLKSESLVEEAALETLKNDLKSQWLIFQYFTGFSEADLQLKSPSLQKITQIKKENFLSHYELRPDFLAEDKLLNIKEQTLHYQKGLLLPELGLQFNYYPYRTGFQENIKWDLFLNLKVPIFSMMSLGKIDEAKVDKQEQALKIKDLKRFSKTEFEKSYEQYLGARKEYQRYQAALKQSLLAYQTIKKEAHQELISDYELLSASKNIILSSQKTDQAYHTLLNHYFELSYLAGKTHVDF